LREDNADARLAHYGHQYGLLSDADYQKTVDKLAQTEALKARLPQLRVADIDKTRLTEPDKLPSSGNLGQLVKMPEVSIEMLAQGNEEIASYASEVRRSVEISYKFDGYIQREAARIEAFVDMENRKIPKDFDYRKVHGLTTEVLTKLEKYRPSSLGEAGRISGVTPAAINAIWIVLR
jgi:tRNA uridine 5-carboxymethylaminomethyl modification enzyme